MPEPSPRGTMRPREKLDKGTVKRLNKYIMQRHGAGFVTVFICIFISAVVAVIGSVFWQKLIDNYITPMMKAHSSDFTPLLHAVFMMIGIYVIGIAASLVYNVLMVKISEGVLRDIRQDMFSHMQTLPLRYFDTHTHGDIMSYYSNDADTLRQMISQSIPEGFSSAVTIVAVTVAMLYLSPLLTLVVFAMLIVMLFVIKFIAGNSSKYFIKQQSSLAAVNGNIEEMINGQKVVKVFNHEKECKEKFDALNSELFESADKANTFANILMPVLMNLGNLMYVLVAIAGGTFAIKGVGGVTVGIIVSFLTLSKTFTRTLSQFSQQLNSIVSAFAGAGRIFRLLDEKSEEDNGYVTLVNARYNDAGQLEECSEKTDIWAWKHPHYDGSITYELLSGHVEMHDVDFGYVPEKTVLHDVSIDAQPGQKLALVGATGAGKTTITNLLNRFYDIADGKIRYDGININKIKKPDLRRSMGMVLQDTNLFTGSIMDNIRYGRLDATDDECIAAAKLANADGFINMLPEGYNTMLTSNGGNLSQGQRQLISIARAAVADPPVMILDEATSSIDTHTEALVQKGMDGLMHGRTVFVIAHRLSTVQNSDVIMVLDGGCVKEKGSHDQLIAQKGEYYQLYTGAFELE